MFHVKQFMKYKITCQKPTQSTYFNHVLWSQILEKFEGKEYDSIVSFYCDIDILINLNFGEVDYSLILDDSNKPIGFHVIPVFENTDNQDYLFLNTLKFYFENQYKYRVKVNSESVYSEVDETLNNILVTKFKYKEYKDLESFLKDLEQTYNFIAPDSYVFKVSSVECGFKIVSEEKEEFFDDDFEEEKVFLSSVEYILN